MDKSGVTGDRLERVLNEFVPNLHVVKHCVFPRLLCHGQNWVFIFGDSAWDGVEHPGSRETNLGVAGVRDAGSLNQEW